MADPRDEVRPDEEAEEEGGGPVKTFLEHLEDLRWVLIKSFTAVIIGMVVCLLAVNKLVVVLTWPLERAGTMFRDQALTFDVMVMGAKVGTFKPATNQMSGVDLPASGHVVLELTPIPMGTNLLLGFQVRTNAPGATARGSVPTLRYFDPTAPFFSSLNLAFFGGMILAAPFVFYFVGSYIVPAMKRIEKRYLSRALAVGVGLFLLGVLLCYWGFLPLAIKASERYALWMGVEVMEWRAEIYFKFVTLVMLGMGLAFEMPVVLLALVKLGILSYQKLSSLRPYAIIGNLVLAALLAPEVMTQAMMVVPLQLLYEISVWIAWYWEWQDKRREAAAAATMASKPD